MKILHIANTDRFSGAENVMCQIINMFKVAYSDIEMAYVSPDGSIRDALRDRGVRFIPLKSMCVSELKRVFKEEKPDVVHAHDMKASFIASLACGNIRLISHLHNNDYANRRISLKSLAFLMSSIKAHHIFYVSQSSYEGFIFHKWFKNKSSVLYNIIDINELYRKAEIDKGEYNYDVIYLGRFTYPKDPYRLLKVIKGVVEKKPDVKVAFIGTGEMEDEVRKEMSVQGLDKNVDMLGFIANPTKILMSSKLMVMTSRWEGTPMCALESMALGTPIISTPTDGLKVLIKDGISGFISNDDDVLVNRIIQTLSDNELRKHLSEACIQDAKQRNNIINYVRSIMNAYVGS